MALYGISYSPYTEKARWALDHHQEKYNFVEHTILIGMPYLRFKTRNFFKDLTVPYLVANRQHFADSYDIAVFASQKNNSFDRFFKNQNQINELNQISESVLDAGRSLLTHRLMQNPQALQKMLPSFIPKILQKPLTFLGKVGLHYINYSFDSNRKSLNDHQHTLIKGLEQIQTLLKQRTYFFDEFSYADIILATTINFIDPPAPEFVKLPSTVRQAWRNDQLAQQFGDLIKWRDQIYSKHRLSK